MSRATSPVPSRILLFDGSDLSAPVAPAPSLAALTQPAAAAPVGAVIDLALFGARGAGKTELVYLLLRTLHARAPDLAGAEARDHRELVAAALGAAPGERAETERAGDVRHAIVHLPVAALLAELGASGRLLCYARAGLARSLAVAAAAALSVLVAVSLWRGHTDAVAIGAAATLLAAAAVGARAAARARWLELGEIEIALWDAPGGGDPAELYAIFDALARERRRRGAPWRRHAFAPVLVVNPLELAGDREVASFGRLRRALPVLAALGRGAPRAMIAVNRFAAVEAVCRPDSDRGAEVELRTQGMGAAAPVAVRREVLRHHCLDAEDGREAGLSIHYLRYDAGAARAVDDGRGRAAEPARREPGDAVALAWTDLAGGLEGDARRAALRFIAALAAPVSEPPQ